MERLYGGRSVVKRLAEPLLAGRLLRDPHYWRDGRVLKESLRVQIMTRTTSKYLASHGEFSKFRAHQSPPRQWI
jgi:hypothetical protein